MTEEETREAIAELTNMPVEIEAVIRKFAFIYHRAGCPERYGLENNYDICDANEGSNCDCISCWLEALKHD
jgi:hypothetical protein